VTDDVFAWWWSYWRATLQASKFTLQASKIKLLKSKFTFLDLLF
jgi:hypothetical protein